MKKKILIGVLVLVILGGIFVFVFRNKFNKEEVKNNNEIKKEVLSDDLKVEEKRENSENKEIKLEKGVVLFSRYNLEDNFQIISFDFKTNKENVLASIKLGSYDKVFLYKNSIYYVNKNGDLESLDLDNFKRETLKLGGKTNDDFENFISSFVIHDDKIFYLKNDNVGLYDLNSYKNEMILTDLENKIKIGLTCELIGFDSIKNSPIILASFGDVEFATSHYYVIDYFNKDLIKLGEANYYACEDKKCSNEVLVENSEFKNLENKYNKSEKNIICNGEKIDLEKFLNSEYNFGDSISYVGCVE